MIPFRPQALSGDEQQLLERFRALGEQDRRTLLAFAEFLAHRGSEAPEARPAGPEQPREIPRPEEESVVAAIRRLSESYFMLDRQPMLNETASLMAAHVIQGRPAKEVVDELESLFKEHFQRYLEGWG